MQSSDENLLFGILAVQLSFIDQQQLVAAMSGWVLDKSKSLAQHLLDQKSLSADRHALLSALVDEHLAMHDNEAEKSLAVLSSIGSMRQELEMVEDESVQASLAHVSVNRQDDNPYSTVTHRIKTGPTGERFRILRPHAKGGIGQVSVAQDEELGREVALKEIQSKFSDDGQSRRRFTFEAEVTGSLEHPGIVPVYGLGHYADGRPYYAMRFIRGDSLQDAIKQFHEKDGKGEWDAAGRELEQRKLLGRFIDVCNAIEYAHSRGVLHRDLKPGNIMLGKYGETLVVDWGLAKVKGRDDETPADDGEKTVRPSSGSTVEPTQMGSMIGTPAYMSPEQAEGRLDDIGIESDVYSLGATLYCLLTGKTPHSGSDLEAMLKNIREGSIQHPRQANPKIPRPLDAICRKAMALRTDQRYSSPGDLAEEIERWMADEPLEACDDTVVEWCGRFIRKHRAASIAGALTLSAVVLVSTLATVVVNSLYQEQKGLVSDRDVALVREGDALKAKEVALDQERVARGKVEMALYALQITSAQRAWNDDNLILSRAYLNRCSESNRGWEYHYLNDRPRTYTVHNKEIREVVFSSDDTQIAIVDGRRASVWNLTSESPVYEPCDVGRFGCVAFTADDARVVSYESDDNEVTVRSMRTGEKVGRFHPVDERPITAIAVSANGRQVAVGTERGSVEVWTEGARTVSELFESYNEEVTSMAFDLAARRIAVGFSDGAIKVLPVDTRAEPWQIEPKESGLRFITRLAFSPDGEQIAAAGWDMAKVWNLADGDVATLDVDSGVINAVAFDPYGNVALGHHDGLLRVELTPYDLQTHRRTTLAQVKNVSCVAFSRDGIWIAYADSNGRVRIVQANTGSNSSVLEQRDPVSCIAYSRDGQRIVSGDERGGLRLWDAETEKEIVPSAEDGPDLGSQESGPPGVGMADERIFGRQHHEIIGVAFSEDDRSIVTVDRHRNLKLWNAETGVEILPWIENELTSSEAFNPSSALAISPDGRRVACVGVHGMQVFDIHTGRELARSKGQGVWVSSVAFSPDGEQIAKVADTVTIWNSKTGQRILGLDDSDEVTSVAFAPDGARLAGGTLSGALIIWDADTGKRRLLIEGHTDSVTSVAYSPDSKRLASASRDNSVRLWDAECGTQLLAFHDHYMDSDYEDSGVTCVAFSPDGEELISGGRDRKIIVRSAPGFVSRSD